MPKYALIHNIGGLTCLLCHLLHFRRFSGHFVEPGLYCISLILPTTANNAKPKVGSCDAEKSWTRPKFQQNSPIKYCQTLLMLQSFQLVKSLILNLLN